MYECKIELTFKRNLLFLQFLLIDLTSSSSSENSHYRVTRRYQRWLVTLIWNHIGFSTYGPRNILVWLPWYINK